MERATVAGFSPSVGRFAMRPGTERTSAALDLLGRPHDGLRGALIAGTNGKGSTGAMLASILRSAGHVTGFMPKPHLLSTAERIQVNGQPAGDAELEQARRDLDRRLDTAGGVAGGLSEFETMTVLAIDYLARRVNLLVCEVGLGGLLDATNVLDLGVCVITNVALDHQEQLGDRIGDIAVHKAGVIKRGNTVVTATAGEAAEVVDARAAQAGARVWRLGQDIRVRSVPRGWDGHVVDVEGPGFACAGLEVPLCGDYQPENAALAVAAAHAVQDGIGDQAVRNGLRTTRWRGRFETVAEHPRVVADAAHNPAGLAAAMASLRRLAGTAPIDVVFGMLELRERPAMVEALRSAGPRSAWFTEPSGTDGHAASPHELAAAYGAGATAVPEPAEALARAVERAGPAGTVLACGSLYLVADVLRLTGRA